MIKGITMQAIDIILLSLYLLSLTCSIYVISAHRKYFKERFKVGVVNVFMIAMLFFLSAYTIKMCSVILIRLSVIFGWNYPLLETIQLYIWFVAQLGTTTGLISLAILTWTKRYDLFVYLRKVDKKGE